MRKCIQNLFILAITMACFSSCKTSVVLLVPDRLEAIALGNQIKELKTDAPMYQEKSKDLTAKWEIANKSANEVEDAFLFLLKTQIKKNQANSKIGLNAGGSKKVNYKKANFESPQDQTCFCKNEYEQGDYKECNVSNSDCDCSICGDNFEAINDAYRNITGSTVDELASNGGGGIKKPGAACRIIRGACHYETKSVIISKKGLEYYKEHQKDPVSNPPRGDLKAKMKNGKNTYNTTFARGIPGEKGQIKVDEYSIPFEGTKMMLDKVNKIHR